MTSFRLIVLTTAAALLAACAQGPGRGGPPGGFGGGPPRARMFISPAGQPFRPTAEASDPVAAWWAQTDRNADDALDRAELKADAVAFFKTLDTDGDGQLSGPEVSRYEKVVAPEIVGDVGAFAEPRSGRGPGMGGGGRRGGGGPRGGGAGRGGGGMRFETAAALRGAAPFSLLNDPQPIMSADYDLSRRVTLVEFQRKAATVFDLLDADHDGRWIKAELPTPPALRAQRAQRARGKERPDKLEGAS